MNRMSDTVIEISGGTGGKAWRILYGTVPPTPFKANFVEAGNHRAYFSHAAWLRLIDTEKGVVIGRWHFPAEISGLTLAGEKVQVEVEDRIDIERRVHQMVTFDPQAPSIPYWPESYLLPYNSTEKEVLSLLPPGPGSPPTTTLSPEEARQGLPQLDEIVQRDPCSPWPRVFLGRLLRDARDPSATNVIQAALRLPSADFSELFRISTYLDDMGEHDLAREAFDRAYSNFLMLGNDPRLATTLIFLLHLYRLPSTAVIADPASSYRKEIIERAFELYPYAEGSGLAWQVYARYLEKAGRTEEARLWRARAEESAANSFFFSFHRADRVMDHSLLCIFAAILAFALYALVMGLRYRPQHRLDRASHKKRASGWQALAFFVTGYLSRQERIGFLSIVLVGWFSAGIIGQYVNGILRIAAVPLSMTTGSYAGPITALWLERHLPPSRERDLILAFAYQQSGENSKAETLYRRLPEFAESWNNLGVILKVSGKEPEARQAFERALQLDPSSGEAAFNLGRPTTSFWAAQHQKHVPDRPMLEPPHATRLMRAFLGGAHWQLFLRALAGPLSSTWLNVGKLV
jgi:tetratricopeptide (TPR) repeat protein